ncbi:MULTISPECIES: ABC transporter ATP-binding protein [Bacillus]|uniref:ABC transporter ATP-binding protein n=1 Tax=Bacillus pseudomycoides TaxID=64104 RepID=A0ABD6SW67_9BACI|nr:MULTISPECIES: ABC transporter ATP-binding protein [Bacillus]KFN13451.1 ABC transporter family protein [Bacillus pseudomycoides]MDR4189814.1 ABC transporter ATP-binding protein [Bacillus pseudomycoides]MED0854247.1 ABC transporter ATP-binding protein [Bacillus pseudomycoides]MED1623908.1 ABC transporter ATP-binding protein [Bacillus pseudomycoides]PDZ73742.1 ABC transporter ATP-binding protein [Bacillus pseudomycoides]
MNFPVEKFFSYYKPYLKLFLIILACALIVSSVSLVFPLLVRYITKDVLERDLSTALSKVLWIGGLMLVLVAVQNIGNYFVDYKGHEVGARMEGDMRSELFAHMQKLSFSFYDKEKTGQLMSRITNDLLMISELFHHGPEDYVKYIVRFVGAFFILFFINAPLTIAVFCFLPVLGVFSLYFNRLENRALRRNKERIGYINAQVEDSLAGIRVVKSFANEHVEIEKFNRENKRFLDSRKKFYKTEANFYNGIQTFIQLITITVVIFGSAKIVNNTLDLADLITFLLYVNFMIEPIQKLTQMNTLFQEGITGFQRFMEIMNLKPAIESNPNAVTLQAVRGEVEFKQVSFRYEDHLTDVLVNMSLQIHPGEFVAFVGPSGVGKTTLCSLIPRFYDVTEGEVLVDGINVRHIDLQSLRKSIGIVQQDVYLFAGTVMENIRYGNPAASDEEIMNAAKHANAHDFIMNLPNGYHSEIGQRGVKLSGGQKQRVSIARVFLKNPPILILDEATSALDNESESIIKESLELLAKGRTTIVIAHRLSTIRNVQRIIVVTKDGIVEQGTHDELLANNGMYANLYAKQFELIL